MAGVFLLGFTKGFAHEGGEGWQVLGGEGVGGGDFIDVSGDEVEGEFVVGEGVGDGADGLGVGVGGNGGEGWEIPACAGVGPMGPLPAGVGELPQ